MRRFFLFIIIIFCVQQVTLSQNRRTQESIDRNISLGKLEYNNGNYKEAYELFSKSLSISGKYYIDSSVVFQTAKAAKNANMYQESVEYFRKCIDYSFNGEIKPEYHECLKELKLLLSDKENNYMPCTVH